VDYVKNTPEDGLSSAASVQTICGIIDRNMQLADNGFDKNKLVNMK
jgi:hypothetical protein